MSEQAGASSPLVDRIRAGDSRALARGLSIVDAGGAAARALVAQLHGQAGRALIIGVTGAPGAGKSTLVGRLVRAYRDAGHRVAVLAVDPSSPFSGGALLGDRVRMQDHASDPGVFIRSLATRGHLGGLSAATLDAATVVDAAGFGIVLIETVGVGQDEVDIARAADVSVLVLVPGAGDDVQAMKAGVMEIADVFVVNKADHEGADRAVTAIEQMIALDERPEARRPPVVRTIATTGEGIAALVSAVDAARNDPDAPARRLRRGEWRLREAVARQALARAERDASAWAAALARVDARELDPHAAAEALLTRAGGMEAIDHIGIATDAVDSTLDFFCRVLGLPAGAPEDVGSQHVRVRFVETGDARIEVVEATDEASPFAASLRSRGPGLHHLALRVVDLASTLDRLAAAGVRLIDRAPRPGAHGTRVAFVHPASTRGVLVELVERTADRAHR